ncbi:MAG: ABC transporter ATP-binding protein [Spirochaetia bacterium]
MKQDFVSLKGITKIFGTGADEVLAVDSVDLEVHEGELVTLLGPSGCGKTTTLRMIAGFEFPTEGDMFVDGERINDVPPNRRPTTMVFQNYALFPHMKVRENIAYGLRITGIPRNEISTRTNEVMRLVGLQKLGERSPAQLSGGQQQRVSLARSLVMEPKVLLLDEPLSNLDAKLRVATRLEIRRLQQRLGITSVYVTHDQEEAMVLSDRVVIMNAGRIQQIGSPAEIYAHPENRFVADFIGRVNFIESHAQANASGGTVAVELFGSTRKLTSVDRSFREGERVLIVARPESIELAEKGRLQIPAVVREAVYLGNRMNYRIAVGDREFTADKPDPQLHSRYAEGEEISISFTDQSLHVLPYEAPPEISAND